MFGGTHVICMIATREGVLPILFAEETDGSAPVLGQLALVRHLARQGYSPSQQLKVTESLGRFCDWVRFGEGIVVAGTSTSLPDVLRRFLVARYNGTAGLDGVDVTGLGWRPAKASTVEADRRNLNKMCDFAAAHLGVLSLGAVLEITEYNWDGLQHRASPNTVHLSVWSPHIAG